MFKHETNTTVHEHRAPTADTARLLSELTQLAEQKVVEAVRFKDTKFEGVMHRQDSFVNNMTEYLVMFSLNGEKRKVFIDVDGIQTITNQKVSYDHLIQIRDAVAKDIANTLLGSIVKEMK